MLRGTIHVVAAVWAGSALGQPLTGLVKWEASGDGGTTWRSHLVQSAGSPYKIRATASWTDGAMASVGFAAALFTQIDLIGAVASDHFDIGSAFALKPDIGPAQVWTVQPGTDASAGYFKIDRVEVPMGTIMNFGQLPKIIPGGVPNPDFDASNPILLLEMDAVASADVLGRVITISGPWHRPGTPPMNMFRTYISDGGTNRLPAREAEQEAVTIEVIPAPAGVFVLAGLIPALRRRR